MALDHIISPAWENVPAPLEYMRHCFEQRRIHVFHSGLEHFKYCPSQCLTRALEGGQGVISRGGPHTASNLTSSERARIRERGKCRWWRHQPCSSAWVHSLVQREARAHGHMAELRGGTSNTGLERMLTGPFSQA